MNSAKRWIAIVIVAVWGTSSSGVQAQEQEYAARVEQLIEDLKQLAPAPTRQEFLGRSAMTELTILGPYAYSALKDALLNSDHWAVKASVSYLLFGLGNGMERDTGLRLRSLMSDQNLVVRAIAASLRTAGSLAEEAEAVLARPEEKAVIDRLRVGPYEVVPLSDNDFSRWVAINLKFIERGKPLMEPAAWYSPSGGTTTDGDSSSVAMAGVRVLNPAARIADVGISNALAGGRGHQVAEAVIRSLEVDDGADPGRLGLKMHMVNYILSHRDNDCKGGCKLNDDCIARVLPICEKLLGVSKDSWALNSALNALTAFAGLGNQRAMELLGRFKDEHPNLEVRKLAAKDFEMLKARFAQEASAAEQKAKFEAAMAEQGKAMSELRPGDPRKQPTRVPANPPLVKTAPPKQTPHEPQSIGSWIAGIVFMFLVVIAITIAFFRRKHSMV